MKTMLKQIFRSAGLEVTRYRPLQEAGFDSLSGLDEIIRLKTNVQRRGSMLLSFMTEPFLRGPEGRISNAHTNPGDSLQIANTFLDLGYDVDVIHYRNGTFTPRLDYAYFVGARTNFARIAKLLKSDCVKIVHLDTAHWVFNNYASYRRTFELQQRKGVTIKESQRIIEQNMAIEHADYATIVGNMFTAGTYEYAKKTIFKIPHTTCATYPWPEDKPFESCRRTYVWLGSNGFVHKGLDLVLDAFAAMPDYHLYVCGPIEREPDFQSVYYTELYQTPNIQTIGWVDVSSPAFSNILNKCIGIIYPSCSEAGAGNAITCMHAGIIPVLSYESGTDLTDDFGMILKDCSIDTIRKSIQTISALPGERLRQMSRNAWEFARVHHTRERFAEEYQSVISQILEQNGKQDHNIKKTQLSIG